MLKEKIEIDFKKALKEKKGTEVSVLRMLKAEIFNREKEKRYSIVKEKPNLSNEATEKESFLEEEEVLKIILSRIKKSRESITEFEKGNRDDLAKKEKEEIKILTRYLPEQLSEEEIKKMAKEIIKEIEAKDIKDMGKVMSELMPRIKGRAEGSLISRIIKELLA
jgi:uncharacterized protein YqeY